MFHWIFNILSRQVEIAFHSPQCPFFFLLVMVKKDYIKIRRVQKCINPKKKKNQKGLYESPISDQHTNYIIQVYKENTLSTPSLIAETAMLIAVRHTLKSYWGWRWFKFDLIEVKMELPRTIIRWPNPGNRSRVTFHNLTFIEWWQ